MANQLAFDFDRISKSRLLERVRINPAPDALTSEANCLAVLRAVADATHSQPAFVMRYEVLAARVGRSRRATIRAVAELERQGLLIVHRRTNRGHRASGYQVSWPTLRDLVEAENKTTTVEGLARCHHDTPEVSLCHPRGVTVTLPRCHHDTSVLPTSNYQPDYPPPPPANWEAVADSLRVSGVRSVGSAIRQARSHGLTPGHVLDLVTAWKAAGASVGLLAHRVANDGPEDPPGENWPTAGRVGPRKADPELAANLIRGRVFRDGLRRGWTREQCEAAAELELAKAGLAVGEVKS